MLPITITQELKFDSNMLKIWIKSHYLTPRLTTVVNYVIEPCETVKIPVQICVCVCFRVFGLFHRETFSIMSTRGTCCSALSSQKKVCADFWNTCRCSPESWDRLNGYFHNSILTNQHRHFCPTGGFHSRKGRAGYELKKNEPKIAKDQEVCKYFNVRGLQSEKHQYEETFYLFVLPE